MHFCLREERIATTLISSTSLARMRSNLDAVQQSLSDKEEATLARLQSEVFGPAGQQSWEGVELAAYWQVVGKVMMTERLYNRPKL